MIAVNPKYIVDNEGKKISVILPIKDFKAIMEELDELEDKKSNEPSIPIDKAFKKIEAKRKRG